MPPSSAGGVSNPSRSVTDAEPHGAGRPSRLFADREESQGATAGALGYPQGQRTSSALDLQPVSQRQLGLRFVDRRRQPKVCALSEMAVDPQPLCRELPVFTHVAEIRNRRRMAVVVVVRDTLTVLLPR